MNPRNRWRCRDPLSPDYDEDLDLSEEELDDAEDAWADQKISEMEERDLL